MTTALYYWAVVFTRLELHRANGKSDEEIEKIDDTRDFDIFYDGDSHLHDGIGLYGHWSNKGRVRVTTTDETHVVKLCANSLEIKDDEEDSLIVIGIEIKVNSDANKNVEVGDDVKRELEAYFALKAPNQPMQPDLYVIQNR
jgi:hypothetical protein